MKRASDDESDFPLRFGENVLVCVSEMPEFPWGLRYCWLEGLLISGEDASGRFEVKVERKKYWFPRDRIQKKNTSFRPRIEGATVLVYRDTHDYGVVWKEGSVIRFHPSTNGIHEKCDVCSVERDGYKMNMETPVNECVVARHYTPPPEAVSEKKIKKLG